ncbi:MAG: type II toxin-antitoxin system prevent-host-death family antitoxin [Ardenticatenales bacterium]
MITTSVTDVKARLSELLRHVAEGETVLILNRGHPIARIEPASASDDDDDAVRVQGLAALGLVRLPTQPADRGLLDDHPLISTTDGSSVLDAFLEDRANDR